MYDGGPGWLWNGEIWKHHHEDQAGYFPARNFGKPAAAAQPESAGEQYAAWRKMGLAEIDQLRGDREPQLYGPAGSADAGRPDHVRSVAAATQARSSSARSLGVAALTSVGFLADRIQGGLQRDARQLLGGDAVLASDHQLAPEVMAQIKQLGLQSAVTLSFPTMARSSPAQGGNSRLVALKAVSDGYPLRGRLQILPPLEAPVAKPALATELNNGTPYDRPAQTTDRLPQAGEAKVRVTPVVHRPVTERAELPRTEVTSPGR